MAALRVVRSAQHGEATGLAGPASPCNADCRDGDAPGRTGVDESGVPCRARSVANGLVGVDADGPRMRSRDERYAWFELGFRDDRFPYPT